jgi:hypothetical protein
MEGSEPRELAGEQFALFHFAPAVAAGFAVGADNAVARNLYFGRVVGMENVAYGAVGVRTPGAARYLLVGEGLALRDPGDHRDDFFVK